MKRVKRIILILLSFSLVSLSADLSAKEKKGSDLVIQTIGGREVKGELIAVREQSLLLIEKESGTAISVDLRDIELVTIKKKSEAKSGAIYGALLGGISLSLYNKDEPLGAVGLSYSARGIFVGAVVGTMAGAAATGFSATITFPPDESKNNLERKEILTELRSKARIKDYR